MKKPLLLLLAIFSAIPTLHARKKSPTNPYKAKKMILLTENKFDEKVRRGNGLILVYFYADWCRACNIFTPKAEELAKKYKGKITFYKVNVDNVSNLHTRYNVRTIPTLLFFKEGSLIDRIADSSTEPSVLERKVDKHLRSA